MVVGVTDLVVVSTLVVDLAETVVAPKSLVDVVSVLRVSLPEVVFSFSLVEVSLVVTEVSLVSTVVSVLAVEDVSLDVSEAGDGLGLELVVVTVVTLEVVVTSLR